MTRHDGRTAGQLRDVGIDTGVLDFPAGSALVCFGRTRVLCAATVSDEVPRWMRGSGRGWVTAEYAMLPASTGERSPRESVRGRLGGRTHEIQRLIGRSLRMAVDLDALGEQLITIDCDVLQADGGTRTAAITGGWVALAVALDRLVAAGTLPSLPSLRHVAAVSTGVVGGQVVCDLDYTEDVSAEVDLNVVATGDGDLIEVQGTAERQPFDRSQLDAMVDIALAGIAQLVATQRAAVDAAT